MNGILSQTPLFGLTLTLLVYWGFAALGKRVKSPLYNSLLLSAAAIILLLIVFKVDLEVYNTSASMLSMILGPATVALAIPLYKQIRVLAANWHAVLISVLAGSLASLGCIFLVSRLFGLTPELYWSLLPKSTTTAIGMQVAGELGGYPPVAALAIGFTGATGAMLSKFLGKWFHITDPVAQGLALGTASHVIGTSAAAELGEVQEAMGSLALITAGIITVVLAPWFSGLSL